LLTFTHVYEPAAVAGAPTLLLLHGTGGDEHDLLPLVPLLFPNAGVLSPRGAVSEHGMPRFFRRLAPGVFDLEDLERRTSDLRAFIDAAAVHYQFDRANVIAVGLSNGANIAANLILSYGAVVRAAVLFRAMPTRDVLPAAPASRGPAYDPAASRLTATGLTNANVGRGFSPCTDVYMSSGRRDRMISTAQTEQLAEQLRDAGASVTLEWDEAGHELTREAIENAAAWVNRTAGKLVH
jgi:phospholipase/carboxylesterase